MRVAQADGTLFVLPGGANKGLLASLLTLSDVMSTGWFAATAANVQPGSTVVAVGDGAVGLLGGALREADGYRADHRNEPA